MYEADCFCVQRMPRANGKTIFYKLFVFAENSSFDNFVAAISVIIEQWVTDMLHMHTYLVRTTRFKHTLDKRYISKSFQNGIMGNSFFSIFAIRIGSE